METTKKEKVKTYIKQEDGEDMVKYGTPPERLTEEKKGKKIKKGKSENSKSLPPKK